MTGTAAVEAFGRIVVWEDGGQELAQAMSLDGYSWDASRRRDGAVALPDGWPSGASSSRIGIVRPIGGRWVKASGCTPGDALSGIVEVTGAEMVELAETGKFPRSAYVRHLRSVKAGWKPDKPINYAQDLPASAKVGTRGRHGGKTRAVKVKLPDAIMRPCGVEYYPRPLNGRVDVDVIRELHAAGRSALLVGPPGTGKTALLEAAFATTGLEYVPGTSDTEAADFVGGYVPEPGGGYRWVDGPLLRAMERGVPLVVDEIALIDPRALSVVYAATDGRRECYVTANPLRGVVQAADGFGLHGACNPDAPGADLSEALLSRMTIQVEYGTDYQLAERFAPKAVVAFARNLDVRRVEGEVQWSPQMRELIAFGEVSRLFGEDFALANLITSAPPADRPIVADLLARAVGRALQSLAIRDGGAA